MSQGAEKPLVASDSQTVESRDKAYQKMVDQVTPKNRVEVNACKAFFVGGAICALGQVIQNLFVGMGISEADAGTWTSIVLVLTSVILTGLDIYCRISKFGGAGALVPITGFANSVAAPAIEFKSEGHVFGIGCKIFTIAGPVILYGILASWIMGLGYYILKIIGVV